MPMDASAELNDDVAVQHGVYHNRTA
jgi:hypothetical protein